MKSVGERIRERRTELNMTQEELAHKLGYKSRATINKIELGVNDIMRSKVEAFAKALQTTPAYLMGWEDENELVPYYLDPEVAEMAQRAYEDPDTRLLLSASRDLSKEDLQYVLDLVKRLKGGEL